MRGADAPSVTGMTLSSVLAVALLVGGLAACGGEATTTPHPYVGMWVTADGHIRQELLPGGRYDEARGSRRSAYTGSYQVSGNHIEYQDDTGFTADGTFDGDVLHHGGYVFYREGSDAHRRAVRNGG